MLRRDNGKYGVYLVIFLAVVLMLVVVEVLRINSSIHSIEEALQKLHGKIRAVGSPQPRKPVQINLQGGHDVVEAADTKGLRFLPGGIGGYNMDDVAQSSFDHKLSEMFRRHTTMQLNCSDMVRLGPKTDGGYTICEKCGLKWKKNDCLVYSFGIGGMWDFEDDTVARYGCIVRAYDPSIGQKKHIRKEKIHFYPTGLAARDYTNEKKWVMKKMSTMMKEQGDDNKIIDFLKMDIDLAEWSALEAINMDKILSKTKQLALEFHLFDTYLGPLHFFDEEPDKNKALEKYLRVVNLLQRNNLRQNFWEPNGYCKQKKPIGHFTYNCYYVNYINLDFLDKKCTPPR